MGQITAPEGLSNVISPGMTAAASSPDRLLTKVAKAHHDLAARSHSLILPLGQEKATNPSSSRVNTGA